MSARTKRTSLRVFNSIAQEWAQWNEWDVALNTIREISHLQKTMYYFVYHVNTIVLYWQEKSTLLVNENKRIDNPRIKIVKCVGVKAQDGNMLWITTKTNNGPNFQHSKVSVIDLVLTDRNLSGKQPKAACNIFSSCRFSFSAARNAITKATEYVTFGFSDRILVFFLC